MTELDKLVARLVNLRASKVKNVTLDVEWLLTTLSSNQPPPPKKNTGAIGSRITADGGSFKDD